MKKYVAFLVMGTWLLSCTSDENYTRAIAGTWSLTSFECCLFFPETYAPGEILWDFNTDSSLSVSINTALDPDSNLPITQDSVLSYTLRETTISLGGLEYDYVLMDNQLILSDSPESDGPRILFTRNSPALSE